MKSVFISHSWHDKALARRIAETVQAFGGRVWLDEAEIKIGDSLEEKIRQGIDNVDYVIALLSNKSVSSEWVKKELDVAMNQEIAGRRVKVLPILATRCELPGFLQGGSTRTCPPRRATVHLCQCCWIASSFPLIRCQSERCRFPKKAVDGGLGPRSRRRTRK